jgi:hypothetical protein
MDFDTLQSRLIAAARSIPSNERVPYAFEKRIMARLAGAAPVDLLGAWSTALWRAAISCLVVVLLSGAWSLLSSSPQPAEPDFSNAFETAVFASAYSGDEAW